MLKQKSSSNSSQYIAIVLSIGALLLIVILSSCTSPGSETQDQPQESIQKEAIEQEIKPKETPEEAKDIVNVGDELNSLEQYYSGVWFNMGYGIDTYLDNSQNTVHWRIGLYNNYGSANPDVQYIDEVDYAVVFRDEYGTPIGEIYQEYRGELGGNYVPGQGVSDSADYAISDYLDGKTPTYCEVTFFRIQKVNWDGEVEAWGADITQYEDDVSNAALYKFGRSPQRFILINGIATELNMPERSGITYYPPTQLYETP